MVYVIRQWKVYIEEYELCLLQIKNRDLLVDITMKLLFEQPKYQRLERFVVFTVSRPALMST
jgi:hypothetical protein